MNIVKSSKDVAKSVLDKSPKNRKGSITNVNNSSYLLDVDLNLPVGTVLLKDKSIITPYAGDDYGFICSSREKQSVIVAPIDGDYNRAVILGRVFDSDKEKIPRHNLGDTLFRHELGSQWSFTYTQPITGSMNLDAANIVNIKSIDEEKSNESELKLFISLDSGETLIPDQLIRVVLNYKTSDPSLNYLTVYIEWEDRVKYDNKEPYIIINDTNTVIGGPLYQSAEGTNAKHYLLPKYRDQYYAMLLSPNKGIAQFSHYTGMGLYMDEYPNRVPIGSDPKTGFPLVDDHGNLKSFSLNNDAFLDDTLDENGQLQNFSRGSLILKHYSDSGLYMIEKVRKTYSDLLDIDKDPWYQSAMGVNLVLMRPTPNFKTIRGMDDNERPMASLIMEDDCKNALYNAMHIRLAHDLSGVQAVTEEEIAQFNIVHRDPEGNNELITKALPGTRPSRLQFYDLKRKINESEVDNEEFKCVHAKDGKCKLNLILDSDGPITIDGKKYREVSDQEKLTAYGSGKEDKKTGAKKCPNWPGCSEGHFTHPKLDIPLSVRDQDIWINNMALLIKPKANLELAHYTNSGLFIEEQLPKDSEGEIIYDNEEDASLKSVMNYHAPKLTLRLREWNHMPYSDGEDEIDYENKINAFEPKLYDSCVLSFETIYGDRRDIAGSKGSYKFDKTSGAVTFEDLSTEYRTSHQILLAQKVYGNKLLPEDKDVQLGNRLLFTDLLDESDAENPIVPADIWEESDSTKDSNLVGDIKDSRLIFPKGKIELLHYTNSGLIIEEEDLKVTAHKMSMSLIFNYWNFNQDGSDPGIYRPVDWKIDTIDPMGIIKWHEVGILDPSAAKYSEDETSFIDFFIYQNSLRSQHITKNDDGSIVWWDNTTDGGDPATNPTGAYFAIRESDNKANDTKPRAPVLEFSDTKNTIKLDSGKDKEKIEIMSRKEQFKNDAPEVNRILMDSMNKIMQFINGYEGMAESGNNSITMNKEKKSIVIQDANDNVITIDDKGIKIEEKVNTNTIIIDSKGVSIEDTSGNKITMASAGINVADKNGNIIDMTSSGTKLEDSNGNKIEMAGGGIKVEAAANVDVKGVNVTVDGAQVKITGGMLTTNGVAAPTGSGPYCAIPACIFSSAPHVGSMVSGT